MPNENQNQQPITVDNPSGAASQSPQGAPSQNMTVNVNITDVPGMTKKVNKHVFVWVGSFLFGGLGVDRFLRGQVGLGILKLLFGWVTLGLWAFIDWIIALVEAYSSSHFGAEDDLIFDVKGRYLK